MPGSVQSVERAAAILRLLAEDSEPATLSWIAEALGLAKTTVHGLLQTLVGVGFVEQAPNSSRYRIAPALLRLGTSQIDLNELRSRAINWTDTLAARSGEQTRVAAYRDGRVVIVHNVFRSSGVRPMSAGDDEVPLHASALGKVFLAYDPGASRSIEASALDSFTFHTITNKVQLARELARVRDNGWATEVEELEPDRATIAAPIRDRSGSVIAAVGIGGSTEQICDNRGRPRQANITQVVRTGRAISRELGHGRTR